MLNRFLVVLLLISTPFGFVVAGQSVEDLCGRLALDYGWYRDHPEGMKDAYADLFTEDAELSFGGRTFNGRKAIADNMTENRDRVTSVHLMTNIRVTPTSDTTAIGESYAMIFFTPASPGPHLVEGYSVVAEYHDEYRLTESGWKIAKRTLVPRFRDAAFVPPTAKQ